jgi:hypothetical protein
MTPQERQAIEKVVQEVASQRFPEGRIMSVRTARDTDFSGDPVLVIQIVIDTGKAHIDTKRASGLTRHLRSKLAEVGEFGFPLLSFISKSDAGNLKAEAV